MVVIEKTEVKEDSEFGLYKNCAFLLLPLKRKKEPHDFSCDSFLGSDL